MYNDSYFQDIDKYVWMVPYNGTEVTLSTSPKLYIPSIREIVFNPPYTIINWGDGTKTVVKCSENDTFSEDYGFFAAVCKKLFKERRTYQKLIENAKRQLPKE